MLNTVYKKWIDIFLIVGICKRNVLVVIAGFGRRSTFWRVVSGFYWNTQNSFTVTMQLGRYEMAWEVWMEPSQVVTGLLLILPKLSSGM